MAQLPRLCGCGAVVTGKCVACSSQATTDDYRAKSSERYGNDWTALSVRYRAKNPLCEACLLHGRTAAATEVHHKIKVSLRPDLLLDWDNLMSVCRACHIKLDKTNE
jgi:5-methylcytosine-specific restriction endonuclease McrA